MKTEQDFLIEIDKSFVKAAQVLDCVDVAEDVDEETLMDLHEDRHHCGTCQVRTVMEVIWPAVEEYIDWLKGNPQCAN